MKIRVSEAAKQYTLKWDNGEVDTFTASDDADAKAKAVEIAKESNRLMGRGGVQLLRDGKVIAKGAVPAAQGRYSTSYWSKDFKGFESNTESEYTLQDWMNEWQDAAIYVCGEAPRGNSTPEFAEFPCVLDINGNWIPRTYYDTKDDAKLLGSVFVADQGVIDNIASSYRHPKASYVYYNSQRLSDRVLREIGEAIEQTIGFEEYFKRQQEIVAMLNHKKSKAPVATWF